MLDIDKVKIALDTLEEIMSVDDMVHLKRRVGQTIIDYRDAEANNKHMQDLSYLGIDAVPEQPF
tara:strand:+ start:1447 stop:1638 length:192 start_codon:yes stop_codon:yes gene_type:complete